MGYQTIIYKNIKYCCYGLICLRVKWEQKIATDLKTVAIFCF
jgi:hypothetical protein